MDFRYLKFMVILAFVKRSRSLPLACPYNGTSYKEGEVVRTEEPCLSCVCQRGALECSLRVCAEDLTTFPPGCFLVHKPNDCCPQLFCEENYNPNGVELRTSFKLENQLHGNECTVNGSTYAEGSALASSQLCEYCYCVEGEMRCIKPRCLQFFERCKAAYEKSSCCPTHYDCRDVDIDFLKMQMKNFVLADVNTTVSNNSLQTLSNLSSESEKEYLSTSQDIQAKPTEIEEKQRDESAVMTTEEVTVEPEKDSTTFSSGDYLTTSGSQTVEAENLNEESSTTMTLTEETTMAVDREENKESLNVQIRSQIDFFEGTEGPVGSNDNSTHEVDDYDSYDYGEPQLPPSLPNLVIFPFVAADAVVKEDDTMPGVRDKLKIEANPFFYKDYFTPPIRTEGGFIPKEPSDSEEPFYDVHFGKEQIEPPSAEFNENAAASLHTKIFLRGPNEKNNSEPEDKQKNKGAANHSLEDNLNATPDPFGDAVRSVSEATSDYLLEDESTALRDNHQNRKPITVTYKNFVVDFYPNYLITTSRGHLKIQSAEGFSGEIKAAAEESIHHSTQKTLNANLPLNTEGKQLLAFSEKANVSISIKATRETPGEEGTAISTITKIPPIRAGISEISFFDNFLKSFLSKEMASTTAMTTTNIKHKYSSKIKSQIITTLKPKRADVSEKVKTEAENMTRSSTSHYLPNLSTKPGDSASPFSTTDKPKNCSTTQRPFTKEEIERVTKTSYNNLAAASKPMETKDEKFEFSSVLRAGNSSGEIKTPEIAGNGSAGRVVEGVDSMKPNAGALLKLAGCNIYGMMYRVGKVIIELSGPCLECLCTNLGVQCRPLKC